MDASTENKNKIVAECTSTDIESGSSNTREDHNLNDDDDDDDDVISKEKNESEGEEPDEPLEFKLGCGILGRYPIISLFSFVICGMVIGIGLSFWRPTTDDENNKKIVTLQWIGLLGDLFLRMLKCIVLPIVFVNVIIAIVDMMSIGQAGGIGSRTVGLYVLSTVCASIVGCIFSFIFSHWYKMGNAVQPNEPTYITLGCGVGGGSMNTMGGSDSTMAGQDSYLMEYPNGTFACTSDFENQNDILWTFGDVNNTFVTNQGENQITQLTLSESLYEGIFLSLFTDNIFQSFYDANYAAVIVFAIAMGVGISKVMLRNKKSKNVASMIFMSLLVEIDQVLQYMIMWVIMLTPFAVLSLIVGAIGREDDLGGLFANIGLFSGCVLSGFICQFLFVYCGGYYILTRGNPFSYIKCLSSAQIMAFASSSSAATIPLSLKGVLSSGVVSEPIANFVIPLGATINMDGACIYIVCSCIWLAYFNGITPSISNYILLAIISTFGSMGAAPVPNASLMLVITNYNSVFNTQGTPNGVSYLFAIDWLINRCETVLNVTGDMTICGIIGQMFPIENENEKGVRASVQSFQHMFESMAFREDNADMMRGSGVECASNESKISHEIHR